jgi:hypothetical protein
MLDLYKERVIITVWQVEFTDQFERWWDQLSMEEQAAIDVTVEVLQERGPGLGRPFVDTVKGSRHANMKELRPRGGFIRILFAFDPRRMAILLVGGDKRDHWSSWYEEMIPVADRLFDEHLATLQREEETDESHEEL